MKKTIIINKKTDTFEKVKKAVDFLVDTVKLTYGPAANKLIIDKGVYRMIVDDGVQGARDLESNDHLENTIIKFVRETAIRTNDRVGDGTTNAMILLQAILNEIGKKSTKNGRLIEQELKQALEEAVEALRAQAVPINTKEELKKVARVSFDNEEIAELIATLYEKIGKDGVVTIGKSDSMETYIEMTDGLTIDNGYISPYMITDPNRMESVLEKPYILLTDYRLTEASDVLPIMEKMAKVNKRQLVIIAENIEQSALSTAVVNKIQNKFFVLGVAMPKGDIDKTVFMEDLAKLIGAKLFSEAKGDKLEEAIIEDLGRAERFICSQKKSIIVEPKGDKQEITEAVKALQGLIEKETNKKDKEAYRKRLGFYTGSLAVIKVGAPTENEQKALKYKVEDAVHATKVAYQKGVVPGAGQALVSIKTKSHILNEALKYPQRQIFDNMGMDIPELKEGEVFNIVSEEKGEAMEVGVVDPVEVLIAGLESAVSMASILVTSAGMIVDVREEEKK